MSTIYAQASARGKAGVAVIRISGPLSWPAVAALTSGPLPRPRQAALRRLAAGGEVLDEALVLLFAEGASFTGESSAELHVHGSVATVSAVLRALAGCEGLRPAEAGEFTRRALENGRLDLTQVEGLADLIDAETEAQRRQALRVASGELGAQAAAWRRDLTRAMALTEATIDFADEAVPVDVSPEVGELIDRVLGDLRRDERGIAAAERIRDGFEVAIIGAPNAGKSTLLNRLAGRDAAITSDVAGTTRDVIEVRMDLNGLAVTLLDTAGLRESSDPVERIGISRARQRAAAADMRVIVTEGEGPAPLAPVCGDILVRNKADLGSRDQTGPDGLPVSALTGEGLHALIARITTELEGRAAAAGIFTRERHRVAVAAAVGALESARTEVEGGGGRAEFVAFELREAVRALDSLVGRVGVEDLLDEIFASFCIGK